MNRNEPLLAFAALLLAVLACSSGTSTPGPVPTMSVTVEPDTLWLRTAGDAKSDQSWAVVTDPQGNLYWGTFQQEPGEFFTDMVIYKYAPDGSLLWQKRWGGDYQEKLFIMATSPDYLLVAGEQDHSLNIAMADMIVLALDLEDGHVIWEFSYDQGFGYEEVDGLVVDGEDIYLSGWTTSETTGNDVGVLKLDHDGHLVWAQAWGGPKWDEGDGQMVVDDEYVYVSGRYDGTNMLLGGQELLVKFRKDTGEYVQHVTWGGDQFYDGYGMTSDGSYLYITGLTIVPHPGTAGNGQIFTQKWDKDFNLLWERQWGESGGDQARAIEVDAAGRVVIAGNATLQGDRQIVLLVYDTDGNILSETVWGGPQDDVIHGLWIDGNYGYLAGQTTHNSAGMSDALLIKVYIPAAAFPPVP